MVVAKENIFKIRGDDEKKSHLQAVFQRQGMKDREAFGRLIDWFCAQDAIVQAAVLGSIPPEAVDLLEARIVEGLKAANSNEVVVREVGQPPTSDEQRESANEEAKTDTPAIRKPAKRER